MIWLNMIKRDQAWSNMIKRDQAWSNMIKRDQAWSNMIDLIIINQIWSLFVAQHYINQTWWNLVKPIKSTSVQLSNKFILNSYIVTKLCSNYNSI